MYKAEVIIKFESKVLFYFYILCLDLDIVKNIINFIVHVYIYKNIGEF